MLAGEVKMDKYITDSPLVRGLVFGLLATLVDGFSLPILHELVSMLLSVLNTGKWHGPLGIAELWGVWFLSGFGFALLPNIVMAVILSVGTHHILSRGIQAKWFNIGIVLIVGVLVTVFYVFLLLYFEILISGGRTILAAIICIEQMIIYGWITSCSITHQRAQK
jgi:hypothetical protein